MPGAYGGGKEPLSPQAERNVSLVGFKEAATLEDAKHILWRWHLDGATALPPEQKSQREAFVKMVMSLLGQAAEAKVEEGIDAYVSFIQRSGK